MDNWHEASIGWRAIEKKTQRLAEPEHRAAPYGAHCTFALLQPLKGNPDLIRIPYPLHPWMELLGLLKDLP